MAPRTRKTSLTEEWKSKIQATQLMNRLLKHFEGEVELSSTQIKAAQIMLNKIIPDLKSVDNVLSNPDGSLTPQAITVKVVTKKD